MISVNVSTVMVEDIVGAGVLCVFVTYHILKTRVSMFVFLLGFPRPTEAPTSYKTKGMTPWMQI